MSGGAALRSDGPSDDSPSRTPEDERALWMRWRQQSDLQARELLAERFLPYARVVAATYYARRKHNEIEFSEYLQFAAVGMMEALDRYDPQVGAQFKTYAARRMHGAILDGLDALTEKQRQIAARRDMRRDRVRSLDAADGATSVLDHLVDVAFGLAIGFMLEDTAMVMTGEASGGGASPPYQRLARRQSVEKLHQVIDVLSPSEQRVLKAHYFQHVPFEEIGCMLGVTKGRISQIHKQALQRMRTALCASGDLTDVVL